MAETKTPTFRSVMDRTDYLRGLHDATSYSRSRMRAVLNGGSDGVAALLGETFRRYESEIPAPNMILTAIDRLAQKLGRLPSLKIDPPAERDSDRALSRSQKRERIVEHYDDIGRLDLQLPQASRWLAGYGFAVWVIRDFRHSNGYWYPLAELRDPYDCYPGRWGPDQQPSEMAIVRLIPDVELARIYPEAASELLKRPDGPALATSNRGGSWESDGGDGVEVVEYYDPDWTVTVVPDRGLILDLQPNPLASGPRFVIAKRFAFDQLTGHYDQTFGLFAGIARTNILAQIANEDAVFTETNIFGDLESGEYQRGRFAINYLSPGSRVEKPVNPVPLQLERHMAQLERQMRIGAGNPVSDDAEAPTAWLTGKGLDSLTGGSVSLIIKEYQTVLRRVVEALDAKRLEWDEITEPNVRKPMVGARRGETFTGTYQPSVDISGDYVTRRVYGVMAGWDEPSKIVTGLQLMQAEVIDVETMRENIDGLEGLQKLDNRIRRRKAEDGLYGSLIAKATALNPQTGEPMDPKAAIALIEIRKNPERFDEILDKYYTPEEPEMSPEEEAYLAQQQQMMMAQAQPQMPQGPPPDVSTVLSRLEMGGGAEGGVQTVGTLRR